MTVKTFEVALITLMGRVDRSLDFEHCSLHEEASHSSATGISAALGLPWQTTWTFPQDCTPELALS
jgi:hypothetical protein